MPTRRPTVTFEPVTLDRRLVRGRLGRLAGKDRESVQRNLERLLREHP